MDKFLIDGNTSLTGEIEICGAKNSAVAILPATLLVNGTITLENVPNISDISKICDILKVLGAKVEWTAKNTVVIDSRNITTVHAPLDKTREFRASYYFLGALLSRFHEGEIGLPGGCKLGQRPIDQHIKGFEALGATVEVDNKVYTRADKLEGTSVYFDVISVGATINVMLAAVFAEGVTTLSNVAKEPHVVDVANFLNKCGANIVGAGTEEIKITGVEKLEGDYTYSIVPDQIEAGTFMCAAVATRGDILIKNCIPEHMLPLTTKLIDIGATVEEKGDSIRVYMEKDKQINATNVTTAPYPGFPTDLQPQLGVCLALANGKSVITENIWQSRFQYTVELNKMGADIEDRGTSALFNGVSQLKGTQIEASDLRAGAALIIAALAADGQTELSNIHFVDRGYEGVEEKFRKLGANIQRV